MMMHAVQHEHCLIILSHSGDLEVRLAIVYDGVPTVLV